jgi:hypothetical protein
MKKLFTFALGAFIITSNSGCDKLSSECKGALSDLTINIATTALTATAGVPFNIQSLIPNGINAWKSCSADIQNAVKAPASDGGFTLSQKNSGGTYTPIETQNYGVAAIPNNSQATNNITTTINTPGEYEIVCIADKTNKVSEISESNNGSNTVVPQFKTDKNMPDVFQFQNIIRIKVYPNPNFINTTGKQANIIFGESIITPIK